MKTVEDWLKELPEPIRSKALANINESGFEAAYLTGLLKKRPDYVAINFPNALRAAFIWLYSNEGYEYWREIWRKSHNTSPQELKEPEG